jgi:hypothetical protein
MPHEYSALILLLRESLTRQRYNPVMVYNYCRNADYFLSHLAERNIAIEAGDPHGPGGTRTALRPSRALSGFYARRLPYRLIPFQW